MLGGPGSKPRVGQQEGRRVEAGDGLDDAAEALGVVCVLGAMERRDAEGATAQLDGHDRLGAGDPVAHLEEDVRHDVPDVHGARGEALSGQMAHGDLCRGEAEVGEMVGDDAVVLLGHPSVERTQTRLEVRQRDVHLDRRKGARRRGVGVPVHHHPVGPVLLERLVHLAEHGPRLTSVRVGTDRQVHVGGGDAEVTEEDIRHGDVVVLTGVDDDVVDPA